MPTSKVKKRRRTKMPRKEKRRTPSVPGQAPVRSIRTTVPTSAISLSFKGLFIFCFNENTECQIGVLSTAPAHGLKIVFSKWNADGVKQQSFVLGPALSRILDRARLIVPGTPPGIEQVQYPNFSRTTAPATKEKHDLRWIIDYEKELHKVSTPLTLREGIVKPVLIVNNGRFFTEEVDLKEYVSVKGGTAQGDIGHLGKSVGVTIDAPIGRRIDLRLTRQKLSFTLPLGVIEDKCEYQLSVVNSRVDEHQAELSQDQRILTKLLNEVKQLTDTAYGVGDYQRTDMLYYYDAIDEPSSRQFDFQLKQNMGEQPFGFPPAECYPGRLGVRTTLL